jgi:capsular polysaccharide biosynthesis protein
VDTNVVVLDIRSPGFSFRNNHLLDPSRRVVYEDNVPFEILPVSVRLLEGPKHVRGVVAYLSNSRVDNYYHWMCLTLPLLGVYREHVDVPPDFYYVGRPLLPWHLESLALLGVPKEKVISESVMADRLVAAIATRRGGVDSSFLRFTHENLGRLVEHGTSEDLVFVSRSTARYRKLVNEDECFDILHRRFGFRRVTTVGQPLVQELNVFANARVIVGTHGAALTNILFAHPRASVLEFLPPGYSHPAYAEICAFRGLQYAAVRADVARGVRRGRASEEDLHLDIEEVEHVVGSMLANRVGAASG